MSKSLQFQGQWSQGKSKINCRLPLIIFEEEGNTVFYCPPLDLAGYGTNEEEAKRSWEAQLDIYFNYTMAKNSLADDLRKLGWTIRKSIRKRLTPPSMSYLLDNNEEFKDILKITITGKLKPRLESPALLNDKKDKQR